MLNFLRLYKMHVMLPLSTAMLGDALISAGLILDLPACPKAKRVKDLSTGWLRKRKTLTMKWRDRVFLSALLSLPLLSVSAQDIYKCADSDGRVTYSNVPNRNCHKLLLDPVNVAPVTKSAPRPAAGAPAKSAASPTTFPKVDDQTQKSRDGDRRRILENELTAEQKNVEQARKELAEQESLVLPSERMQGGTISGGKVEERIQQYKNKLALHQRNVEAIAKEIATLR